MRRLVILSSMLALTACSAEANVRAEIEEANYCSTIADCELVGSKCPFDCYIYANTAEADRIRTLVEEFDSTCEYSCVASEGVDCVDNRCVARTQQPGNAGAACESHDDCSTPMEYLVRSSCPFTSFCVEGACTVACPIMGHHPDPNVSESMRVSCTTGADCDCGGYLGEDKSDCRCIDGACAALVR